MATFGVADSAAKRKATLKKMARLENRLRKHFIDELPGKWRNA
jgi:hypothetical protein